MWIVGLLSSSVWWPTNGPASPTILATKYANGVRLAQISNFVLYESFASVSMCLGASMCNFIFRGSASREMRLENGNTNFIYKHSSNEHCKYHIVICHLKPFNAVFGGARALQCSRLYELTLVESRLDSVQWSVMRFCCSFRIHALAH